MFLFIAWILIVATVGSSDPIVDKWAPLGIIICVILHFIHVELVWRSERAERLAAARRR